MNDHASSLRIAFRETAQPILEPVTKFGGRAVWITEPQWPLSRYTGKPMMFIAQVALDARVFPQGAARMAYIFMNENGGDFDTFDPDAGENAVILQPGRPSAPCLPLLTGPCIQTRDEPQGDEKRFVWRPVEYAVDLTLRPERAFVPMSEQRGWSRDDYRDYEQALSGHKIGGAPYFFQNDQLQFDDWHLILQLDSYPLPFWINFGDGGIGYAIANADFTQAKFLWQCH